jgi:hypothetical protein
MICHACLAFSKNRYQHGTENAWQCDHCGSHFMISRAADLHYTLPHPGAVDIPNPGTLTGDNFKKLLKKQRGKVREVFIGPMPDKLAPANNVINVMSETGELIFMQRHGFGYGGGIDKDTTHYIYEGE